MDTMPTENRSKPSLPRVPVSKEVYEFAQSCSSIQSAAHKLLCSQKLARALRRNDLTVRVTPLELEAMELQARRLTTWSSVNNVRKAFKNPTEKQKKFINLVRAVAKFVSDNKEDLDKMKRGASRIRFYSAVAWYHPLYELTGVLIADTIPHLRQTWHDFPECRDMFFKDTGFEEKYMTKWNRNPVNRKITKREHRRSL